MGQLLQLKPGVRAYAILYRQDVTNHCPGCGHTNWFVGRQVAECAFCSVVLPLSEAAKGYRYEIDRAA